MVQLLKRIAVPKIREFGFKGSFPHYRRITVSKTDLISFQFSQWGQKFAVNAAKGPPHELSTHTGKLVYPSKMTSLHVIFRKRIGPKAEGTYRLLVYVFRY